MTKKAHFTIISGSCLVGLLYCCLLSSHPAWSLIAVGITLIFLLSVYSYRPGLFIKYLAFIFAFAAGTLGVIIIEFNSIYLTELREDSSYVGSLPSLLFAYSVFVFILVLFDDTLTMNHLRKEILQQRNKYPKYMLYFTYITIIIYAGFWARVITKPAFLLKVNRFGYARDYMFKTSGIWGILSNQLLLLTYFPLMSFIMGYKITGLISLTLYVCYSLWTGNKFGPFFSILCVFLILIYPQLSAKTPKKLRLIIFKVIFLLLIIVFLALVIEFVLGGTIDNYTLFRFSGQGEMWWGCYKEFNGIKHIQEFSDEIVGIFHGKSSIAANVGSTYGIYKLMYLIAPKSVIDAKLSTGSRYTESGFACAYYYLGLPGCVLFALLIGIVVTSILNDFIKMIREERYLRALLLLRLFMLTRESQSMFVFFEFIDILSIMSYFLLFITYKKKVTVKIRNKEVVVF